MSDAEWHGKHLTEDEIVEDLLARIRAEPGALESWKNCGPAVHFTGGMMVRNWYGLWRKDCPLTKPADGHWLALDADDVSARIIKRVLKALAEGMKVLVCGGRDYVDRERLNAELDRLRAERGFSLVIAGGARGADTLAEEWAASRGIPRQVFMAEWAIGRKAGPIRNERMLAEGKPDLVVGFPGGRGTAHMCRIAREAGIEVIEIPGA